MTIRSSTIWRKDQSMAGPRSFSSTWFGPPSNTALPGSFPDSPDHHDQLPRIVTIPGQPNQSPIFFNPSISPPCLSPLLEPFEPVARSTSSSDSSHISTNSESSDFLSLSSLSSISPPHFPLVVESTHMPSAHVRFADSIEHSQPPRRRRALSRKGSRPNLRECHHHDQDDCTASCYPQPSVEASTFLWDPSSDTSSHDLPPVRFSETIGMPNPFLTFSPTSTPSLSTASSVTSSVHSEPASWLLDASPDSGDEHENEDRDEDDDSIVNVHPSTSGAWFLNDTGCQPPQDIPRAAGAITQSESLSRRKLPSWKEKLAALKDRLDMLDESVFSDNAGASQTDPGSSPHRNPSHHARSPIRCAHPTHVRAGSRQVCCQHCRCCHTHYHCHCCSFAYCEQDPCGGSGYTQSNSQPQMSLQQNHHSPCTSQAHKRACSEANHSSRISQDRSNGRPNPARILQSVVSTSQPSTPVVPQVRPSRTTRRLKAPPRGRSKSILSKPKPPPVEADDSNLSQPVLAPPPNIARYPNVQKHQPSPRQLSLAPFLLQPFRRGSHKLKQKLALMDERADCRFGQMSRC